MADNEAEDSEAEVLEEYVTGYQRVRLPSGAIVVAPGPELAARLAAGEMARARRAGLAQENAALAARNAELAAEAETLRNVPPEPPEVARLRAELHLVRRENLSLRAALDSLTSEVIRLQNGGAESLADSPELSALADADADSAPSAGAPAPPHDGAVPPGPDLAAIEAEAELTPFAAALEQLP